MRIIPLTGIFDGDDTASWSDVEEKFMGGDAGTVLGAGRPRPHLGDRGGGSAAEGGPLGPENVVVFAPRIIAGTSLPNSGRLSVGGKSPLTGMIKESNSGGTARASSKCSNRSAGTTRWGC